MILNVPSVMQNCQKGNTLTKKGRICNQVKIHTFLAKGNKNVCYLHATDILSNNLGKIECLVG